MSPRPPPTFAGNPAQRQPITADKSGCLLAAVLAAAVLAAAVLHRCVLRAWAAQAAAAVVSRTGRRPLLPVVVVCVCVSCIMGSKTLGMRSLSLALYLSLSPWTAASCRDLA